MEIEEALKYGLVNYKTDLGMAMDTARDIAARICEASPTAVSTSLEMIHASANILDPITALENSSGKVIKVLVSEDLQIGLVAFLMKQSPKWKNR